MNNEQRLLENRTIDNHTRLELRDMQDGDGHTLEGIAVPFNTRYRLFGDYAEVIDNDCDFGTRNVKVSREHGELIGTVESMSRETDGLHVTVRLANTTAADETAELVRTGVYDAFSIGFAPVENRIEYSDDGVTEVHRRRVDLCEIAVTGIPAYPDAAITSQRSINNQEERNTMDDELKTLIEGIQDEQRAIKTQLSRNTPQQTAPLGAQYRSAGDWMKHVAAGDEQAVGLIGETRDLISSTDVKNTSAWVADQIRLVQSRRSIANLFVHNSLPAEGMTLEYLKLGSNTIDVTQQSTEGDPLATGKLTLASATAEVKTFGGYTTLSRQVVERSNTPALETALRAMTIAYAKATENEARATLASAITANSDNKIVTGADNSALTADQLIDAIVDAADKADDIGAVLGTLVVSSDVFKAFAKLTRSGDALMNVSGSGPATLGTVDLTGITGSVLGVRIQVNPSAAANTAAFVDPTCLQLWESGGPFQLSREDVTKLTNDYSVYGYMASACVFNGIIPLAKA